MNKVLELRGQVNEYFRGNVTRDQAAAELRPYENEPWFGKGYLYSSSELPEDITRSKWHYQMDHEPLAIWKQVTQPTLFLFAETDEWVPIEASMRNYQSAAAHLQDVTIKQVKGTSHLMSVSQDRELLDISEEYLSVLRQWLASKFNVQL